MGIKSDETVPGTLNIIIIIIIIIHKGKIERVFKRKKEKQGNAWALYKKYR